MHRLARAFALALLVLTAGLSAQAQSPSAGPVFPDTRAGRKAEAWVSYVNSNDPKVIAEARRVFGDLSFWNRRKREMGGIDVIQVMPTPATITNPSDPENQISWLARERLSGQFRIFTLGTHPAGPFIFNERAAQRPAEMEPPPRLDDAALSSFADDQMVKLDFNGVVLVAREGHPLFVKTRGLANRDSGMPFTPQSRFFIGSMTRMVTAVAVLQLAQAGKFSLDAPLAQYARAYPLAESSGAVTVRRLLTNQFAPTMGSPGLDPGKQEVRMEVEMDSQAQTVLAQVVEAASGMSYQDYVRRNIFAPASMVDSGFSPKGAGVDRLAVSYCARADHLGGRKEATERYRPVGLAGDEDCPKPVFGAATGAYATAADLLAFAQALTAGRLLDARHTRLILDGRTDAYGAGSEVYGMTLYDVDGVRRLIRSGQAYTGSLGWFEPNGELRIIRDGKVVIVALSNLNRPTRAEELSYGIFERVRLD